jgi:alpha-mannosidase
MTSYQAQYVEISQSLQYSLQRHASRLERLTAQLDFANQLCGAHPDRAPEWRALILEAGRLAQQGLKGTSVDLDDLVSRGEAILAPIGEVAKSYALLCVSHAHIDMNWMWSWPETVAVTNDTFRTMLALMDEFPQFIYSQSQASTYELIERYNPAMFDQIRRRIGEGRWEVTASQWVEGDKNMSSGESISRHLLYTREYMRNKFGLAPEDVQVDFEPDTFGHPATLPTILARGGVKYYYHCRGSHGPHLYWWVGPDGSRLLAFNDIVWYMCAIGPQIADPLVEYAQATGLKFKPVLYGVGDHGGGPTRRDLRRIVELNEWPVYPRVEFSSLHRFFREAEANKASSALPQVAGERNFVFTGCYTSQARIKWANRHGENTLYAAEAAAALGSRAAGVPYPHRSLDEAWKHLLFDQFHDILPGSGKRETRHYALGRAQESQAAASMARSGALRALSERVDTASLRRDFGADTERAYKDELESGRSMGAGVGFATGIGGESASSIAQASDRAFLIFNPLPYARSEVVEATLWDVGLDEGQLVVTAEEDGGEGLASAPVQVLETGNYWGHEYLKVAFPVGVPALGYRAVCISDRRAELGLAGAGGGDPWAGMLGSWRKIEPANHTMENEWIRVRLDPASGGIASLLDKRTGREWVPQGSLSALFQHVLEANQGMSSWVIGQFLKQEDLLDGGVLTRVHGGPYLQCYRWTRTLDSLTAGGARPTQSRIELDITVRRGAPCVEFRLRVDWREIGHPELGVPNLRTCFALDLREPQPRYEVPFGSIRRDMLDGQEVPAQRWVDLSEEDGQGVTLANSSKYGFALQGGAEGEGVRLSMTLLRASIEPDPLPDLGEHEIAYALVPHGAGWTVGDSVRVGEEMNVPLVVSSCGLHGGELPSAKPFVQVQGQNVRLASLKEGQDGRSLVLRLVEVEGRETEARVLLAPELAPPGTTAAAVDTLERPLDGGGVHMEGHVLRVQVPAYGVVTVQLTG